MSQSPPPDSNQRIDISDASIEGQVGQAGHDITQLQGQGSIYKDVTITNIYNQGVEINSQLTRQEYLNRRALLTKVRNFWVEGVLKKSLHKQVLLTLGLEARSDAVASPWTSVLTAVDQPSVSLPQETQTITLFDELGAGRTLLILGEPGAGKTIVLLQLADALIARAEQDSNHLIPVVFNLSSWHPPLRKGNRQSHPVKIAEWLVEELGSKYQVPRKIGKAWVEQQQLLLLLDGLDEVKSEYREDCAKALNAFQEESGTEVVVCCRRKDYESLSVRLNFQRAIFLKPLTLEQIHDYINQLQINLTGLRALLDEDVALQELAQSPLMLSIMILAYQGLNLEDLPKPALAGERRKQLFDNYLERMLQWRGKDQHYTPEKTIYWLGWLAGRMVDNSQTIFLIERIQPDGLQKKREIRTYKLFDRLLVVLISGFIIGLISLLIGKVDAMISLLIITELFGSVQRPSTKTKTQPAKKLNLSWTKTKNTLRERTYKLFNWLLVAWVIGFISGLISLLMGRLDIGLFILAILKLTSPLQMLSTKIQPAEKLSFSWTKTKNTLNGRCVGWLIRVLIGIFIVLLIVFIAGLMNALLFAFIGELFFGLIVLIGLNGGLTVSELEVTAFPNQGIWNSLKNSIIIFGLVSLLFGGMLGWLAGGLPSWLIVGSVAGLVAGLPYGGEASIQHFALRLTLYQQGLAPWNYAQFLNHAVDRLFLQKVGGGYIFVHRLLMEHFAAIGIQQDQNRT